MKRIAKISWDNYTKRVLLESHPSYIICVGMGVGDIVKPDIEAAVGGNYSIIPQPNARLSSSEHIRNFQCYFEICSRFASL